MGQPGFSPNPGGNPEAFKLRYQLRRRFERGYDPEKGESELSALALDQLEKGLREGNKDLIDICRKVLEEHDGPQRQAVDHAITYSIVEIVGEDVEEDPPASTDEVVG